MRFVVLSVAILGATMGYGQVVLKPMGAPGVALRIRELKADAIVDRQIATTKLALTFQNPVGGNFEAEFVYALPPDTLVTHFAYYFQRERVVAKVAERERAAEIYRHITTQLRDPALIEMTGKRTFRARIFPVDPGADLRVEMTLVQALPNRRGVHTYVLPTKRVKGDAFDRLDVTVRLPGVGSGRNLRAECNMGIRPTVERDATLYRYKGEKVRPDRDFRVQLTDAGPAHGGLRATLYAARSGGPTGYFGLALSPTIRGLSGPVRIRGVRILDMNSVRRPSAASGAGILLTGRYRGSGPAVVNWSGAQARVFFPRTAEPNHPALKLWAAREIERSGNARKRVVTLSKRHNLPSKFTSWIAIPVREREQYRLDKLHERLRMLGDAYVRSLDEGFRETRRSRALRVQHDAVAKELGFNSKTALDSSTYSAIYRMSWDAGRDVLADRRTRTRRTVERLIARGNGYAEAALRTAIRREAEQLTSVYANEIAEGRANGARAREIVARLSRAKSFGIETDERVRRNLVAVMNPAAYQYESERREGAISAATAARVRRIAQALKTDPKPWLDQAKANRAGDELRAARSNYVQLVTAGKDGSPEAQRLRARIESLRSEVPRGHWSRYDYVEPELERLVGRVAQARYQGSADAESERKLREQAERYGLHADDLIEHWMTTRLQSVSWELSYTEDLSRLDEAKLERLRSEVRRLEALGAVRVSDLLGPESGSETEWTVRRELLRELRQLRPDPVRVRELERKLARYSSGRSLYGVGADKVPRSRQEEAYTEVRIERLRTDVLLDKLEKEAPSPQVEAERKRLEALAAQLRARMGDPLLTFDVPANAKRVVAVMPDGEVKPMAWVPLRGRWEVRFDVPASAREGEVTVRLIAVLADGSRREATTSYHVDLTPPTGRLRMRWVGDRLWAEVEGSEDLARVTFVAPGGVEVNLPRAGVGRFGGYVPVAAVGQAVKGVLFDKAHNLREIEAVVP